MPRTMPTAPASWSVCMTGGTGLLGKGMEETAPADCRIVSLHLRDYPVDDPWATHIRADVRDARAVESVFRAERFDAVVHAAGIGSVDYAESHYAEAYTSNIEGTRNVALQCREAGSHLVYISTNAVFDGRRAPYREDAPVCPVNKYGEMKAQCEALVREIVPSATIVRPILMYGWNHLICRQNPVTWMLGKLMRGEVVHVVNDVRENPLYNRQCGLAIWEILRRRAEGTFHIAGRDVVTRDQFALLVAKVFDQDPALVRPVSSAFFPSIAPRPPDTTFVTERMQQDLGIEPLGLEAGLRDMKQRMQVRV